MPCDVPVIRLGFTPGSPNVLPRSFDVRWLLDAFLPTLQALCAHLNSPGTTCTFAPDNCPTLNNDRHLLAPCTFCGRYFRSSGVRRHQHYCFHRSTTPFQPRACGASLPRSAVSGGGSSKAFFESYLFSFQSSTSSNGVPPSGERLVKPVFEEIVSCVLSFRDRATQGASAEAAWAALPFFPRLVSRPIVDFISARHLPPNPVVGYRDNRLAHWASRDLDTLLSAARAHASLTNWRAPPLTSLPRAVDDPMSTLQFFHNGVSAKVANRAARLAAVGEYRRAMEALKSNHVASGRGGH
jgi:hypothetical protein